MKRLWLNLGSIIYMGQIQIIQKNQDRIVFRIYTIF